MSSNSTSRKVISLDKAPHQSFFAENIRIYSNKCLNQAYLILFEGLCYVIRSEMTFFVQPFKFDSDMEKIVYSDQHDNYLALKLKDVRKFSRDHIIFESINRELFADYIMDYCERKNLDEVPFE